MRYERGCSQYEYGAHKWEGEPLKRKTTKMNLYLSGKEANDEESMLCWDLKLLLQCNMMMDMKEKKA